MRIRFYSVALVTVLLAGLALLSLKSIRHSFVNRG